tara:strand:+ start:42 stop:233 length:192 start_codon:yes stop_codon:yes gene_type:complete
MLDQYNEIFKALREASVSIACCLDDVESVTKKDLEHIQKQITILEEYLDPFYVEELENMKNDK